MGTQGLHAFAMSNRRFPEITGEIIRNSEALRQDIIPDTDLIYILAYIYIVHDFRMEAPVEKRWSVTVLYLQAWTYTILDCQLRAMREKLFFFSFFSAYYGLFGGATCNVSVWNGGLTESTASVRYLHRVLD